MEGPEDEEDDDDDDESKDGDVEDGGEAEVIEEYGSHGPSVPSLKESLKTLAQLLADSVRGRGHSATDGLRDDSLVKVEGD